jgi:ribosomal protein S18 acetylase RimI-like enzyme
VVNITNRPYVEQVDQAQVEDLVLAFRVATRVDIYPTIWRFRLLLTSRVWEPDQDVRVWEDRSGHIIGFAMLWRRQPDDDYVVLDQFVHPFYKHEALFEEILAWAIQRTQILATQQIRPIRISVNALDPVIDKYLARFGFAPVPTDFEQHNIYFICSLGEILPSPVLPAGYVIRPMHGLDELKVYHSLFEFSAVNEQFEQILLASDEYSHFVVVSPSGQLVSYCEFSICRREWEQCGQRIGWIDYIGTAPEQRQQGLGRAILLASLQQMQTWGADTVMLITVNVNTPAVRLYNSTGFIANDIQEPLWYTKQIII